jgi:hypothetical protein
MTDNNMQQKIVEDHPRLRSVGLMAQPALLIKPPRVSQKPVETTRSAVWTVNSLPRVPANHILERTHVSINDTSPQLVARRVADSLRSESIAAEFHECEVRFYATCGSSRAVLVLYDTNEHISHHLYYSLSQL